MESLSQLARLHDPTWLDNTLPHSDRDCGSRTVAWTTTLMILNITDPSLFEPQGDKKIFNCSEANTVEVHDFPEDSWHVRDEREIPSSSR